MENIIKQKINNGKGKIQLQNHGLVDVFEYNENNHPNWNQTTKDEFQLKLNQIKLDCKFNTEEFDKDQYKIELEQLNEWLQIKGIPLNSNWQDWANDPIVWQPNKYDYNLVNIIYDKENNPIDGDIELKSEEQKQEEIKAKKQRIILNKFQSLRDAINFQEMGKDKGINPNKAIFTEQQVIDWCEYIANIANGNLDAIQPELTQTQKIIFRL